MEISELGDSTVLIALNWMTKWNLCQHQRHQHPRHRWLCLKSASRLLIKTFRALSKTNQIDQRQESLLELEHWETKQKFCSKSKILHDSNHLSDAPISNQRMDTEGRLLTSQVRCISQCKTYYQSLQKCKHQQRHLRLPLQSSWCCSMANSNPSPRPRPQEWLSRNSWRNS